MTEINFSRLYNRDGSCRICGLLSSIHEDDCPGRIVDRVRYEAPVEPPSPAHSGFNRWCALAEMFLLRDAHEEMGRITKETESYRSELNQLKNLRWAMNSDTYDRKMLTLQEKYAGRGVNVDSVR